MYTNQHRAVFTPMRLGFHAAKAAATLPQGTTQEIFTVTGGRVLVSLLFGEATVALGGVANDLSVQMNPTTGTTYIIASAIEGNALEAGGRVVGGGGGEGLVVT